MKLLPDHDKTVSMEKIIPGGAKLSDHWRGARRLTTRYNINNG